MGNNFEPQKVYRVDADLEVPLNELGESAHTTQLDIVKLLRERDAIERKLWAILFKRYPELTNFIFTYDWVNSSVVILDEAPPHIKEAAEIFLSQVVKGGKAKEGEEAIEVDKDVCYFCGEDMSDREGNICKACSKKVDYKGVADDVN